MLPHTPRLFLIACAALLAMGAPSGRPPTGPLDREKPQIYDVSFGVQVRTLEQRDPFNRRAYNMVDAPIVLPVVFNSTFSQVDPESLSGRLWLGGVEDTRAVGRSRTDDGLPFHTHLAVMTVPEFQGHELRWQITWRAQVWSSRIDDEQATRIAWPETWPDEVKDGLRPQMYVESDDEIFQRAVEDASGGRLRFVPPYLAAKDLVRYCIKHVDVVRGATVGGPLNTVHGLKIVGAREAVREGRGSPHDLVCVCVATLRAAGIPARPVVGFHLDRRYDRFEFISWAEFYLPDAGWIPFDPNALRGNGSRHRDVRQPWIDFGTMENLNKRVPIAFHFIPPTLIESPVAPGVWGWDPRPGGDPSSQAIITVSHAERGEGKETPQ